MFKKVNPSFQDKNKLIQKFFFPAVVMEWNTIDANIHNSAFCNAFKKGVLKFIRPEPNQVFIRIILRLSHLADHKFRHNF